MNLQAPKHWSPRTLLHTFIYGSLTLLLVCLFVAAFIFSETYLKKEQARESDSAELISHFFDSHYRGIREEMWTRSYDAIHIRISDIARQIGQAKYDLFLFNESQECVFHKSGPKLSTDRGCDVPPIFKALVSDLQQGIRQHILQFDYKSDRYIYLTSIYVGPVLKGYLYTSLSDPYEFHRENGLVFVVRVFGLPIFCIVLVWLLWLFVSHRLILRPYLSRIVSLEKKQAVGELASQVAHNIRSPLVVLNSVVRNIRTADPTQRRLLISAASRIEKIANGLMAQLSSQAPSGDSKTTSFCFLLPVIESIIAEKIAIQVGKAPVEISYQISDELYGVGVPVSSEELTAVFSNLLNNAIEAFTDRIDTQNRIEIRVQISSTNQLLISIEDNGNGMPPEVLNKLRTVGGTYGKQGGSGIGLPHAKETLAKAGGTLRIESILDKGTKVILELPQVPVPSWCPTRLDLSKVENITVLDDDPGLHLLWQQRLGNVPCTYLTDPSQFIINRSPLESSYFILDYEFEGNSTTGLDLISNHQLGNRAVLVTSYFNDPELQHKVIQAGAMMLPKFMINRVQITLSSADFQRYGNRYDLVLIDDDPMIHELWNFDAAQMGKVIKTISTLSELNWDELPPDTPIFVDKNLGNNVSGLQVARDLYSSGFQDITLTTGEDTKRIQVESFIREVRNKDFPIERLSRLCLQLA